MIKTEALRRRECRQALLTVVFTIISVIYLMPVLLVLINSLKANAFVNTETFKLPTAESFVGLGGGFVGGRLFQKVSNLWLRRIFACFLLYGGVRYLL